MRALRAIFCETGPKSAGKAAFLSTATAQEILPRGHYRQFRPQERSIPHLDSGASTMVCYDSILFNDMTVPSMLADIGYGAWDFYSGRNMPIIYLANEHRATVDVLAC